LLKDLLEGSDEDRAALIGRLAQRDDATWLAEQLIALPDADESRTCRKTRERGYNQKASAAA
jgi:hypothetical protein